MGQEDQFEEGGGNPTGEDYNDRMNRAAERDWNAKHGRGRSTGREAVVIEAVQNPRVVQAPQTVPGTSLAHPLEVEPVAFKTSLALRTTNRQTLVTWLRDALKRGADFDSIHVMSKKKCSEGNRCTNPYHWSKDQLFKPGAEKICGMLGVTPSYPNLGKYEEAAIAGTPIRNVIMRCQILAIDGHVVAEGVGASGVDDYTDLNKALKMACKSAHVDATLRMAGLSEIFTTPETPTEPKTGDVGQARVTRGKYQGDLWADIDVAYIKAVIDSKKSPPEFRREAQAELDRRPKAEPDFDDDF